LVWDLGVYVKRVLISKYNLLSKLSSSPSFDNSIGKMDDAKCVTSAYQENTGLNTG